MTTAANATMAPVHDRMPVFVPQDRWEEWLDPTNDDLATLSTIFEPTDDGSLVMDAVSTDVNNIRNNGPDLLLSSRRVSDTR